ncbi:hypothetical protein [Algoriphagus hitonicola]|uniref:Uncharacterized protein n=1 Tax=Algoriphagus hitonicola TaxID=435880 RepID=A0A1I2STT5_9BACT|nr:hypothetical protein [Algoriphagus hitonicola]SFG55993.1 hypothetical protein SAMN04487988_10556 [Algoriphagus hitonicola]
MKSKSKFRFLASLILASAFGVFLGISPLTSFGEEAPEMGMMDVNYCLHNVSGDDGLANFCQIDRCAPVTGQGTVVGPCGSGSGMGE